MRILMNIRLPHEPFNAALRAGTLGETLHRIIEDARPEAVYFTESGGRRAAVMVVNVEDQSQVPALAEPWFLHFQAECEFKVAMTPEDLQRAGLDQIAERWR